MSIRLDSLSAPSTAGRRLSPISARPPNGGRGFQVRLLSDRAWQPPPYGPLAAEALHNDDGKPPRAAAALSDSAGEPWRSRPGPARLVTSIAAGRSDGAAHRAAPGGRPRRFHMIRDRTLKGVS
eukprot:552544-Hanusia_phi.AAC.2